MKDYIPFEGSMKDRIPSDPTIWLEHLLDVNARSQFSSEQKIIIASGLRKILEQLGSSVPTTR